METLTTTDIAKRLGFTLSVNFILSLGIEPLLITKTSVLWRVESVNAIRLALIEILKSDIGGVGK